MGTPETPAAGSSGSSPVNVNQRRTLRGTTTVHGDHPLTISVEIAGSPTVAELPDLDSRIVALLQQMVDPGGVQIEGVGGDFSKTEHNKGGVHSVDEPMPS